MCQAKIDGHSRSRIDHPRLVGVPRCLKPDKARCPITHSCASLKPTRRPAGRPGHCLRLFRHVLVVRVLWTAADGEANQHKFTKPRRDELESLVSDTAGTRADHRPTFSRSSVGGVPLTSRSRAGIQCDPSGGHRCSSDRNIRSAERRTSREQREHRKWRSSFVPDRTR